jgi:hypothetical protein
LRYASARYSDVQGQLKAANESRRDDNAKLQKQLTEANKEAERKLQEENEKQVCFSWTFLTSKLAKKSYDQDIADLQAKLIKAGTEAWAERKEKLLQWGCCN